MDSGSLILDSEIDDELDVTTPASPEEIIWLMDELMYREVRVTSSASRSGIIPSR